MIFSNKGYTAKSDKRKMEKNEREFDNPYPKFNEESASQILNREQTQLNEIFARRINNKRDELLKSLEEQLVAGSKEGNGDYSVYTGATGISFIYLHLADRLKDPTLIQRAFSFVERPLTKLKGRRVSFLCGDAGPLAVAAVIAHKMDRGRDCKHLLHRLPSYLEIVERLDETPDEVMYGRAGFLYSLLYVRKHIGTDAAGDRLVNRVITVMLESGQRMARENKSDSPLMYQWHDKQYVGAAHGLAGIYHTLLLARQFLTESQLNSLVKPAIDYLLDLSFRSGNFPSSLGNHSDRLVHWCHGAPGLVHLFCLAHKVFGEDKYLQTAVGCGEVIWQRGILRKGYGICHGVAGNGYAFLQLFQTTQNPVHLYRAARFAEWCLDYGKHDCRTPDRPNSLFEGLAGTIYFLTDMGSPALARFPAFAL